MPQPILASVNSAPDRPLSAQWVHDIRNALAVTGLHLEALERLSGPKGQKAASAAHAVMTRVAGMCSASLAEATRMDHVAPRRGFDLMQTINEIVTILAPIVPEGFEIRIPQDGSCMVLANPGDIYRIMFNLVQNAIAVARSGARMSHVGIGLARNGSTVAIRIFDDGPGLPEAIRSNIFRLHNASTAGGSGLGIAIARELAERNGGTLRLSAAAKGASYILELTHLRVVAREGSRGS
jgi:signal transduction histidine kinase